ncbi:MAG: hypothetical protein JWO13_1641 [Acidobacteriales bacterium]|nr:hypothetical protein [Terriglobales bacterium]
MTVLIIIAGIAATLAIFGWLNHRPVKRSRSEVRAFIESALVIGGGSAWDDFVSIRISDPALESIRLQCLNVNLSPKSDFDETLRRILSELE